MLWEQRALNDLSSMWCSLTKRPRDRLLSAELLLDYFWATVATAFLLQQNLADLVFMFQQMQAWMTSLVFPSDMKTHGHNRMLMMVLASLLTIQLLAATPNEVDAAMGAAHHTSHIGANLGPEWYHSEDSRGCNFISELDLETAGEQEEACVYALFNCSSWYVGKALLCRQGGKLGISCHIMEHLSSSLRKAGPAARSTRAVLLRQKPAASLCFLILKRGPHEWMKASEVVAIRTLRLGVRQSACNSSLQPSSRKETGLLAFCPLYGRTRPSNKPTSRSAGPPFYLPPSGDWTTSLVGVWQASLPWLGFVVAKKEAGASHPTLS